MEVAAKLRGARLSAQKARLVANQIRGKHVEEALDILAFSQKKGAARPGMPLRGCARRTGS